MCLQTERFRTCVYPPRTGSSTLRWPSPPNWSSRASTDTAMTLVSRFAASLRSCSSAVGPPIRMSSPPAWRAASRTPVATAQIAATVDEFSGGRCILGIGVSLFAIAATLLLLWYQRRVIARVLSESEDHPDVDPSPDTTLVGRAPDDMTASDVERRSGIATYLGKVDEGGNRQAQYELAIRDGEETGRLPLRVHACIREDALGTAIDEIYQASTVKA